MAENNTGPLRGSVDTDYRPGSHCRPEAVRQADERIQGTGRPDGRPQGIHAGIERHRRGQGHHRQRNRCRDARHGTRGT